MHAVVALLILAVSLPAWAESDTCDSPKPIRFATGASAGRVSGGVPRGEIACWKVGAKAGQRLDLVIESPERNAVVQIYVPGWKVARDRDGILEFSGSMLPGAADGDDAMTWSGILPATGNYLFTVGATRGGAEYDLLLKIK